MYVIRDEHGISHLVVFAGPDSDRYPRTICSWWQHHRSKEIFRDGEGLRRRAGHPATCVECITKEPTWTT